jgi:hypothetical protein
MARKTIDVERVRELTNAILLNSVDRNQGVRFGAQVLFEKIAMETGNYAGFGYLNSRDMKDSEQGMSVGINDNGDFEDTDHSRVYYFKARR